MGFTQYAAQGWRGVVDAGLADRLPEGDPLEAMLRWPNQRTRHRPGRVEMWRVESPGGVLYVRLTDRQHRRAMCTLRVHRRMEAAGLHVPRVRAVLTGRRGTLLVADEVAGYTFQQLFKKESRDEAILPELQRMAFAMAALHARGFIHGDPLPGNMVVRPGDGSVAFIDNERTRKKGISLFPNPWPCRPCPFRANLVTLLSRMLFHHRWRRVHHFLDSYEAAWAAEKGIAPFSRAGRAKLLLEARARWHEIDRQLDEKERRPQFLPRRPPTTP